MLKESISSPIIDKSKASILCFFFILLFSLRYAFPLDNKFSTIVTLSNETESAIIPNSSIASTSSI